MSKSYQRYNTVLKQLERKFILELLSPIDFSDETRSDVIFITGFG